MLCWVWLGWLGAAAAAPIAAPTHHADGRGITDWLVLDRYLVGGEQGRFLKELATNRNVQAEGPARKWEHTHSFVPIDAGTTEVREHIEFEHRNGFWGVVTRLLFSRPNLLAMFTYRKFVTRWCRRGR